MDSFVTLLFDFLVQDEDLDTIQSYEDIYEVTRYEVEAKPASTIFKEDLEYYIQCGYNTATALTVMLPDEGIQKSIEKFWKTRECIDALSVLHLGMAIESSRKSDRNMQRILDAAAVLETSKTWGVINSQAYYTATDTDSLVNEYLHFVQARFDMYEVTSYRVFLDGVKPPKESKKTSSLLDEETKGEETPVPKPPSPFSSVNDLNCDGVEPLSAFEEAYMEARDARAELTGPIEPMVVCLSKSTPADFLETLRRIMTTSSDPAHPLKEHVPVLVLVPKIMLGTKGALRDDVFEAGKASSQHVIVFDKKSTLPFTKAFRPIMGDSAFYAHYFLSRKQVTVVPCTQRGNQVRVHEYAVADGLISEK